MSQPIPAPRSTLRGLWVAASALAGATVCCGRIGYDFDHDRIDDATSGSAPSGVGSGGGGNGGASGAGVAGGGTMDAARTDVDQGGSANGDDDSIEAGERDAFESDVDAPIGTGDGADEPAIADASMDIAKDQSDLDTADANASVKDAQPDQGPPKICSAGNCTCNGACSCPTGGCTVTCTGDCAVDCPGSCRVICPMNTTCSIKCAFLAPFTCPRFGCDFTCN